MTKTILKAEEGEKEIERSASHKKGFGISLRKAAFVGALSVLALCGVAKAQDISVDASTEFATEYIAVPGKIVGEGPVNQTEMDFNIGKRFTESVWTDYDFGNKALNEVDNYFTVHSNTYTIKNSFLKGKLSSDIGFWAFAFPSDVVNFDRIYLTVGCLKYDGIIDVDMSFYHLLNMGDGNNLTIDISKPFKVINSVKDAKLYIGPTLRVAYNNDFIGTNVGYYAPGISMQMTKGSSFDVGVFVRRQFGSGVIPDITYGGISLRVSDIQIHTKDNKKH